MMLSLVRARKSTGPTKSLKGPVSDDTGIYKIDSNTKQIEQKLTLNMLSTTISAFQQQDAMASHRVACRWVVGKYEFTGKLPRFWRRFRVRLVPEKVLVQVKKFHQRFRLVVEGSWVLSVFSLSPTACAPCYISWAYFICVRADWT